MNAPAELFGAVAALDEALAEIERLNGELDRTKAELIASKRLLREASQRDAHLRAVLYVAEREGVPAGQMEMPLPGCDL